MGGRVDEVNVPESFGGWIESETVGGGLRYRFDAMFDFNLTYMNTGPNGFATSWYELDHIDAMHESLNAIGTGCRFEAKSSAAADQLRRRRTAPLRATNAGWTFAIHVDFSIPDQTVRADRLPAGRRAACVHGDIVNYLYTAPGAAPFRPIWSGSTATDMRLIDSGRPTSVGPGCLPTTATLGPDRHRSDRALTKRADAEQRQRRGNPRRCSQPPSLTASAECEAES